MSSWWLKQRSRTTPKADTQTPPQSGWSKAGEAWMVPGGPDGDSTWPAGEPEKDWRGHGVLGEVRADVLHGPLLVIRYTLKVLGIAPYTYSRATGRYSLKWSSCPGVHTLATFLVLTALLVTTTLGLVRVYFTSHHETGKTPHSHQSGEQKTEVMCVVIIVGCLLNAWANVLNIILQGRPLCHFLNQWGQLVTTTRLDPSRGLKWSSCVYAFCLYAFVVGVVLVALLGPQDTLLRLVDVLAQVLLLVPPHWLLKDTLDVQAVRCGAALVVGYIYLVYKGSLFLFVLVCRMLHNVLHDWRRQLSRTLTAIWSMEEGGAEDVGMDQLVQSHYQVVQMVRQTERVFSLTLQCFYATQVVTLCLELYLVAYRVGVGASWTGSEALWQIIIISQTCIVFLLVSLKASTVCEEAERSVDTLRRGLPFHALDQDKFHFGELEMALTSTPICISGGRFFSISRPFIITVVGAVLSYFVIALQLNLPSTSQPSN